jgi:tripartite-type tricarboxylate transporter receptor subunit TctC
VPTFREQGVDLVSTSWFGLSGPAGLPAAVSRRLAEAASTVLAGPVLRARFAELGGTVGALGPTGYTEFVRDEIAHWAPAVQASGAGVD